MGRIIVIGAGVVGLSTALELQDRGHQVTIIAECIPGDTKSARFTSPWAGAHHVSLAGHDVRQQKMDQDTFKKMWEMSAHPKTENLFLRIDQTEYAFDALEDTELLGFEFTPEFRRLSTNSLPPFAKWGASFKTVTIDTPNYLLYLLETFKIQGGELLRISVQHISQVVDGAFGPNKPDAVVCCAGIGARTLGGVEDEKVFPIRGQTVLLKCPHIKFGRTASSKDNIWTYVIPRRSGDVIVGGTKGADDWYPYPRPEITEDILSRVLQLCPELVSEEIRSTRAPTLEDLKALIIEEGCGLRPARKGGIRLESVPAKDRAGRDVPIVFNYGHGGYGFQSSWGSATMAADLLTAALGGTFGNAT